MSRQIKIGVFDSGRGGLSVARAIEKALPEAEILFRNDTDHLPYGSKPPEEIFGYVLPILQKLVQEGCQVIVVACNTVTTTLINELREQLTVPLVAVEPMVKPAAEMTQTGIIAVCATPTTLASERYDWLKNTYAKNVKVIEPDCSDWTRMIEDNEINEAIIGDRIESAIKQGADVVVLGCTHYHWIEELVNKLAKGQAKVIQPEPAVVEQLKRVLSQLP